MKAMSAAMQAHVAQEVTSLCSCWKIVRRDGKVFGFTDHDRSFLYDNVEYEAQEGFNRTAIASDGSLAVDNLDVTGFLDSEALTEEDMRNGLFNFASVYVFLVNWADLSMGEIKLRRGWFGEITTTSNGEFTIELRGLTQALGHGFAENYSPECRADFCDDRCTLSLLDFQKIGSVKSVNDKQVFVANTMTVPSSGYAGGSIEWTSGQNEGRAMEVTLFDSTTFVVTLFEQMVYPIQAGDTFKIATGCDKSREACVAYGNILNFRGEPDVPGQDEYLNYPDAQT